MILVLFNVYPLITEIQCNWNVSSIGCHEDGDKNSNTRGSTEGDQTGNVGLQQTESKEHNSCLNLIAANFIVTRV